jgi:hypothetical protein
MLSRKGSFLVSWREKMKGRGEKLLQFLDSSSSPSPFGVSKLTPQGKGMFLTSYDFLSDVKEHPYT